MRRRSEEDLADASWQTSTPGSAPQIRRQFKAVPIVSENGGFSPPSAYDDDDYVDIGPLKGVLLQLCD